MAFWDSLGESLTDFTSAVSSSAGKYVDGMTEAKVENAKKAASAAPEENRTPIEQTAQQPTGAPVQSSASSDESRYLRWALFGMMGLGLVIAFRK